MPQALGRKRPVIAANLLLALADATGANASIPHFKKKNRFAGRWLGSCSPTATPLAVSGA